MVSIYVLHALLEINPFLVGASTNTIPADLVLMPENLDLSSKWPTLVCNCGSLSGNVCFLTVPEIPIRILCGMCSGFCTHPDRCYRDYVRYRQYFFLVARHPATSSQVRCEVNDRCCRDILGIFWGLGDRKRAALLRELFVLWR